MTITPEKIREIEVEITKFLRHLMTEQKELRDIDVVDIKNFNLNMHPELASLSMR